MRNLWLASLGLAVAGSAAFGQVRVSERGQPRALFSTSDFGRLRWLEGTWMGTAPGEQTIYERYRISSDSTIDVTYYRDSALAQPAGTGRVYLAAGRVYHSLGPGRWGATQVDSAGAYFVPQVNAHNTFTWSLVSPDEWTATMRTGLSGHERITVYRMRRIGDRR